MLFNDRFGLQRLYYHEAKDTFYFAAEAKAILKVRPELRAMDPRGVGEFIVCGCVLENRTLFSGIHVLPPGSSWYFRGGTLEKKAAYFEPREWEEEEPYKPEDYFAQLRDVFVRNLPRYFNGNERVGVSLTGGLDTRIIMAWRKAEPNSLPCYTFGSMYRDNQDVQLARRVAKICGQSHQVITTGTEFSDEIRALRRALHLSHRRVCGPWPFSGSLRERKGSRNRSGADGRDLRQRDAVARCDVQGRRPTAGTVPTGFRRRKFVQPKKPTIQCRQVHPITFVAFRQSPWHHYGVLGLEQTQVAVRSPLSRQ